MNLKRTIFSYHISGTEDLIESDEVKSILTLFYYIARKLDHSMECLIWKGMAEFMSILWH